MILKHSLNTADKDSEPPKLNNENTGFRVSRML